MVALTITLGFVPTGVPGSPVGVVLLPPHAGIHSVDNARMVIRLNRRTLRRVRLRFPSDITSPSKPETSMAKNRPLCPKGYFSCAEGGLVCTVNTVVAAAVPFGVTLAGLKEHVASDGRPEGQLKVTAWLKPPCEVTVMVDVPLFPGALMVMVVGFAAMVKFCTISGEAGEVEPPKAASPAKVAVTE